MTLSLDEWYKKKKNEEKELASLDEWYGKKSGKVSETKKSSLFQAGAFEDGYQFGDVVRTILGTVNDASENATTAVLDATENLIDTAAYGVGWATRLFDKSGKAQDDIGKFIGSDFLKVKESGEGINRIFNPLGTASAIINGKDTEKYSVLGDKADGLVQSGAHLIGSKALGAINPALAYISMAVNAFGGEIEQAYQNDATHAEAGISGAISAGAEILFEKLSGGIKILKGTTLDESATRWLSTNLSQKIVRTLAKMGMDLTAEGAEEVATEAASALGRKLTYADEAEWEELFSSEDAWDAFWGGVIMSGFAGGGKLVNSYRNGVDYTSGLTATEEKVVNKLYKDAIAKEQSDGKKLSSKRKDSIYNEIVENMQKGYISTDIIEETLGGETYKAYKNAVGNEDALKSEFDTLNKMKQGEMTGEQLDRRNELKKQLEELKENSQSAELKARLDSEMSKFVKNNRLSESYRESARRGQAFEADLNQYQDEYSKKTIKNIMDSKIANNTNLTHEFADMLAKMSADQKRVFDFTDNEKLKSSIFGVDGKNVNGYITKDGITINLNSPKALQTIVGHEISHVLEGTDLYDTLQSELKNYLGEAEYSKRLAAVKETYKDIYKDEDAETKFEQELTADLVGDLLFTDKNFVSRLYSGNRNLFQKIFDEVKYLCRVATAGSKQARQLEKIKHTFEEVYKEGAKAQKNTATEDGVRYALESKIQQGKLDPRTVTKDDVLALLHQVEDGSISGNTYIPLRIGTPQILIYWADKRNGDIIDNNPIAISADKAYNAMNRNGETSENGGRPNRLTADEIVAMVENMNDPEYIVYQGVNDRYVEVVKFNKENGDSAFAVLEIGNNKDAVYMNGYEGGLYNILVTTYPPISGKLKELLNGSQNKVIYDKKKDASQRTSSSTVPSVLNDTSFYEDIISEPSTAVKKFSLANKNIAPVKDGIYGKDIALRKASEQDLAPVRTDIPKTAKKASDGILAPTKDDIEAMEKAKRKIVAPTRDDLAISNEGGNTNAISRPLNSYPIEKQKIIRSYIRAVDKQIKSFVERVKNGDLRFERKKISDVSQRAADDIKKLLGIDATGYTNNINTSGVQHIIVRHGANGKQDTTMSADDDIARVGWVLENYDSVELLTENGEQVYSSSFMDKNNNPAPQVRFVKKIDGTYYVVEAAFENDYKKLWVQSAYLQKNEDVTQASAEGNTTDHGANAQSALVSPSSNDSISKTEPVVNSDSKVTAPTRDDIKENGDKVAEVLTEEPKTKKKKGQDFMRAFMQFRSSFFDKGSVFEDLSLKTKNRELIAKWNSTLSSDTKAQRLIGGGADGVKALNDIRKSVEDTGKTKEFYEYMYHLHNVDRMSLEAKESANLKRLEGEMKKLKLLHLQENRLRAIASEKITKDTSPKRVELLKTVREYLASKDVKNKPVFGSGVTAQESRSMVQQYEKQYPQFKKLSQDVYGYLNHLRNLMVDKGVISQETADLWAEMYPHYVPIRRAGDKGLNINVPLDTGRTGVNVPIKAATGGNSDILPLFDTIAQRTVQTYKAIDRNSFGIELKNTLGSSIATEAASVDDVIDSVDTHEELLQAGKYDRSPTFTVFENGKRVTFEINEDMYDALKPASSRLSGTSKVLNTFNNIRRGLLTEYNPTFMATNPIKDVQDVLINSQHPARTYASMPEATKELWKKNGKWYKEYMENGGEQNTYFDKQSNTFDKEKSVLRKALGLPLDKISAANNFIERIPRLAEYIASRKAGASIDVAMLDAARVTTNFAAGGDVTKFLNRNGFTFLNASVQGFNQQIRNIREAKRNGLKGVMALAAKVTLAGLPALLLNSLLWDDDEDYEELSDYVKDNYYIVGKYGDGNFVRIPKGRAAAVIQDAFEQVSNTLTGDDEADWQNFGELLVSNLAPNNPLDNNLIAPIAQVLENKTWYGEDLVPSRLQDLPEAEQYDESTDAISKWLGETTNTSPYKWNYLLDQYSGGLGDVVLPMLTPEAESGDNSFLGNVLAPMKDKFTTDSVMNNQNVSDFYDTMDELTTNAKRSAATDEDILKNKYFNSVNSDLSDLYKQKREIQNSGLPDESKYMQVRTLQKQIDEMAKKALGSYNQVSIYGDYATVADQHYKLNDEGEWKKLSDSQVKKLETFGKAVGGNAAYISYTRELSNIKSDRDRNGDAISGSRKKKVVQYINSLNAGYGEKLILYKSQYTGDDTYNYEIVEYLNSRDDLSYTEMKTILEELGFKVLSDGRVRW